MRNIEEIKEFLTDLNDAEMLAIYREYADRNYYESVYDMEEFDEIMSNATPTEIARKIYYGEFNPNDNYFIFDGNCNLESADYLDELIDYNDIAQYIYDNDEDFDNNDLRDFLDNEEEQEES